MKLTTKPIKVEFYTLRLRPHEMHALIHICEAFRQKIDSPGYDMGWTAQWTPKQLQEMKGFMTEAFELTEDLV